MSHIKNNKDFIKSLFASIAKGYDQANFWMTLGLDSHWRKKLVSLSQVSNKSTVLDCATGTGKLAELFSQKAKNVIGIDFCKEMLALASTDKANLKFLLANVEELPFTKDQFDITSIAYGIRNVSDPIKALEEMARVTKPKGQILILETGHKIPIFLKPIYYFHTKVILPVIGKVCTGNSKAYRYLEKSSSHFPCGNDFVNLMQKSQCFSHIKIYKLFFGVSYIYQAFVN